MSVNVNDRPSGAETLVTVVAVLAIGLQTWLLVQEATDGEAGRALRRWWAGDILPRWRRLRDWIEAPLIVEAMVSREIVPWLIDIGPGPSEGWTDRG